LANEPGTLPIAKEKIKLSIAGILNSNVVSYDDNYLTQYLEEKTGIEIQFDTYTGADAGQKLDLQVNSGSKLSDIIAGIGVNNDTIRYKYGQAGAIISLNEYYLEIADWFDVKCQELGYSPEKILNEIRSEDGQIYAAPARSNSPGGIYALHAFINHDWLQKLNLQLPMTSDEFITVLRAFRDNDPNENGKKDEIPMIGSTSGWNEQPLKYLMNMFIYLIGPRKITFCRFQTNGKIDVAYDKRNIVISSLRQLAGW
jgi:putative aldouronate transport system substrate-binding protein